MKMPDQDQAPRFIVATHPKKSDILHKSPRQLMNDEMAQYSYKGDLWFAGVIIVFLFGTVLGLVWWAHTATQ